MYSRVYLEITDICNKNCSFCHGTKRAPRLMSESELKHTLKELKGITEYIYFHLMGEPLCHPELVNYIKLASSEGFRCAVTTNGTLLMRRSAELLDSGVYKVNISLHSFEGESSSEREVYLSSCLDFADKASKRGILVVLRLWNGGECERNAPVIERIKEYFPNGEWKFGARGARIRDKLHIEYGERFEWPDIEAPYLGEQVFCYGLSDHFGILSDGTVVPCCLDGDGAVALGNVYRESLTSILSSPRALAIKEGFKSKTAVEELCKRCGYARRFKV